MSSILLRLLEPDGRLHVPPSGVTRHGRDGMWVFPFGPQQWSEERPGRVQLIEVPRGVIPDVLGLSTPRYRLEVTFGNKSKTLRGETYTAQELHDDLHRFLGYYFNENRRRLAQRLPLIEMAYDDFYQARHWIIVPSGAGNKRMSAQEPTRPRIVLEFTGVRPATVPAASATADPTTQALTPLNPTDIGSRLERYCPLELE